MSPASTTLLVCDDTAAKRYVISSWLRRAGYDVIGASSAAEAMRTVATRSVDLVVLDVHLPDRSGLDVAMELKSTAETAAIPVVHISAVAMEPEHRSAGLDRGADAYLVDPIEPQELVSTVGALLRSSGARRRAESLATRLGRLNRAALRLNVATTGPRLADAAAAGVQLVFGGRGAALVSSNDPSQPTQLMRRDDGLSPRQVVNVEPSTLRAMLSSAPDLGRVDLSDPTWSVLAGDPTGGTSGAVGSSGAAASGGLVAQRAPEPASVGTCVVAAIRSGSDVVGFVAVDGALVADHDDERMLAELAQAAGVAVENLRAMEAEHRTALILQRSLLPAILPPLDGLQLVARYRAADGQSQIGGDFFDAFVTDQGRAYVVIGDVQGHSLEAAVLMAELRYTLRAYAHDGHSPRDVLERLDLTLHRSRPDMTATLCLLALDPPAADGTRSVEVANAGHLPPLLVRDGEGHYLDASGPLLGGLLGPPETLTVELRPGDRLVLITDGLVERRGEDLGANLEAFAATVTASAQSAEALSDVLMAEHGRGRGHGPVDDDSALVLIDVTAPASL